MRQAIGIKCFDHKDRLLRLVEVLTDERNYFRANYECPICKQLYFYSSNYIKTWTPEQRLQFKQEADEIRKKELKKMERRKKDN